MTEADRTPNDVREGVRSGILDAIKQDVEHRGGRTARLLVASGVAGVFGAIGITLLISGHPFGHHPPWHVAVFSAVWAGLLVVALAFVFLRVRTPTLPLSQAAMTGVLALGLAGICGAICPDQHFLHWWSETGVGGSLSGAGGIGLAALCFGGVTTLFIGFLAALMTLTREQKPLLPAFVVFVMLVPGVVLQSVGASAGSLMSWLAGTAAGAFVGVAAGVRARSVFSTPDAESPE